MVKARMINKETNTESILIDKKEVDDLKAEVVTLRRKLKGIHAYMKAQEVEIANWQEKFCQYDSNIGCRVILKITQFFKRSYSYIRNAITANKYTFMQ